jgi:hypothetical protein
MFVLLRLIFGAVFYAAMVLRGRLRRAPWLWRPCYNAPLNILNYHAHKGHEGLAEIHYVSQTCHRSQGG